MEPADARARLAGAQWLSLARPFFDCLEGDLGHTKAVGGIVRDTLLGRDGPHGDIDLATELAPERVMALAEAGGMAAHPTGIAHGTVTLVHAGRSVEVTTLRRDVETFGRRARVAFGSDWHGDASRRDFTMNALYCTSEGALFDPLGGLSDCLAGRVRFIGDPDQRIAEDRLRVFRFFRFCASHGAQKMDVEALAACSRSAGDLGALSAERVGWEMMRLLDVPQSSAVLDAMAEIGVLSSGQFAAGLLATYVRAEDTIEAVDATARLALAAASGLSLEDFRDQWRLSNGQVQAASDLADAIALARSEDWAQLSYRYAAIKASAVALAAALADRPKTWRDAALAAVTALNPQAFPISGRDLLENGFEPGPEIGVELHRLETLWMQSRFTLDRSALLGKLRAR